MDAGQQRDEHGERDGGVQQARRGRPSHQVARAEQGEAGGVAEGEPFADGEVDEESGDPGPVGVFGDDGAEQQRAGRGG